MSTLIRRSVVTIIGAATLGIVAPAASAGAVTEGFMPKRELSEGVLLLDDDDNERDDNTNSWTRSAVSRDATNSRYTKVSRDRDRSRGDLTRDWTRDGGDRTKDKSRFATNDRSLNDTRRRW